jgi:beta-aspartyl-dipeptidase (metallo-type)
MGGPMNVTLLRGGHVYASEPHGRADVLLGFGRILQIGHVPVEPLRALGWDVQVIDLDGAIVAPGLIDPHQHVTGAGGEHGFGSRMPEVTLRAIVMAGITTVVGLLGTDTTTRTLRGLHAKCAQLEEEGITAYMYTGGFELPPKTFTGSVLDDLVLIDRIIGTGEISIADERWIDPDPRELAFVVKSTTLGGQMSGKAGVTHFHVGDKPERLALLVSLLDDWDARPEALYATHITRSPALMDEAIALAHRGVFVDIDTVEENFGECLTYYVERGGPLGQLTVSSDAHTPGGHPSKLYRQLVSAVQEHGHPLERVLPLFTANPAAVLGLAHKGRLESGADADVLVLDADTLAVTHLFGRGRHLVGDGELLELSQQERAVTESER